MVYGFNKQRFSSVFGAGVGYDMKQKLLPPTKFYGGGSKTTTKRKSKKPYYSGSTLRKVIRGMESAMHNVVGQSNFSTVHNTVYCCNLTFNITQGSAQDNRQGDSVYLNALKASIFYESPFGSANGVTYRVLVHWSDIYKNSGSWSSGTIGLNNLFFNLTGNDRSSTGLIDPKTTYVVYDELVTTQPNVTGTYAVSTDEFRVQLNKAINYLPGTNEVNPRQLYMTVIPSVANGTTGLSDGGKFIINTDLIFKNSK